ncbi:hypothetical protein BUALT_Bualt02G0025900 [Buddleja alternifolia]|uniref:DDE Tnp4 domain-containing protein n=1 Tax=Buddleja alternifolia TaxID=168488 RepID=A0AAV6XYH0_9LAMI|nr:hypothetical protein BUALT_Bualt02G0025900 [Buddleja alternifolia]
MDVCTEHQQLFVLLQEIISDIKFILMALNHHHRARLQHRNATEVVIRQTYSLNGKMQKQIEHLHDIASYNDQTCINNLRMSRNAFGRLCFILESAGGLVNTKNVQVSEQDAIFLSILAHHKKNMIVKHDFKRSGYTISKYFNNVLSALLKLHGLFLVKPTPIEDESTNDRWKWFKGCLGALDGTYLPLRVAQKDKPRYRNRKGDVSTNVLAVHARARNVIERSFALFKGRWAILRSNSFYPVKVQNRIVMACALLHNYIRVEMPFDPLEAEFPEVDDEISDDPEIGFIDQVEPSQHWTNWRDNLATEMFDEWRGNH